METVLSQAVQNIIFAIIYSLPTLPNYKLMIRPTLSVVCIKPAVR